MAPAKLIGDDVDALQTSLAWVDLFASPSRSDATKFLVLQKEHVKVRMRPETNHALPHFHIEYKKQYAASYQIDPLQRLAGDMPKQYEEKVWDWIVEHRTELLATWAALKDGKDVRELVV